MYGVKAESNDKGGNEMVRSGEFGFEGMQTTAHKVEQTIGEEEMDWLETGIDDYLSGEDTVVTINLWKETNSPLAYATGLELHQLIMSKLREHGGK